MITFEIKGDWKITQAKLKQKWAELTADDLSYVEGRFEELLERIQKRTGASREAVRHTIRVSTCGCGCN